MSTEIATKMDDALAEIDEVIKSRSLAALGQLEGTRKAIALAQSMNRLRGLIAGKVLDELVALAGTDLGYRTDRDNKPAKDKYSKSVIRDVLIEGMLRGAQPVGNEINIIAGRCYLTKQFFERMVRGLVEELRIVEGVPKMSQGGALVPMVATWRYQGKQDELRCTETPESDNRIAVRVNAGMGVDAVLGKAYRKLYARIYRRVTGSTWIEDAVQEPPEVIDVVSEPVEQPAVDTDSDEPDDDARLAIQLQEHLAEMTEILEVNEHRRRARAACKTEEQLAIVDECCDAKIAEIRESRGERTN